MGYDDDAPELHQHAHLVESTGERRALEDPTEDEKDYEVEAALCRSPRLWFGRGRGHVWPALETEATWVYTDPLTEDALRECSVRWATIDCQRCIELLFERGCPRE